MRWASLAVLVLSAATVAADSKSKTYGDDNPAFSVRYSGFVNGDGPGSLGGTLDFTTAAAATLAMHGRISAALAGSTTVLASLASAAVNLPIVWRATKNRTVVRRVTIEVSIVIGVGILAVAIDRIFQLSELLVRR